MVNSAFLFYLPNILCYASNNTENKSCASLGFATNSLFDIHNTDHKLMLEEYLSTGPKWPDIWFDIPLIREKNQFSSL